MKKKIKNISFNIFHIRFYGKFGGREGERESVQKNLISEYVRTYIVNRRYPQRDRSLNDAGELRAAWKARGWGMMRGLRVGGVCKPDRFNFFAKLKLL